MWDIEFGIWWETLSISEQEDIDACVTLLKNLGPKLSRPYCDTVKGSKHSNMKELRTQSKGKPLRTLFAFDPKRTAILLIGGDKKGDKRFYEKVIPIADELLDKHLKEINNG